MPGCIKLHVCSISAHTSVLRNTVLTGEKWTGPKQSDAIFEICHLQKCRCASNTNVVTSFLVVFYYFVSWLFYVPLPCIYYLCADYGSRIKDHTDNLQSLAFHNPPLLSLELPDFTVQYLVTVCPLYLPFNCLLRSSFRLFSCVLVRSNHLLKWGASLFSPSRLEMKEERGATRSSLCRWR